MNRLRCAVVALSVIASSSSEGKDSFGASSVQITHGRNESICQTTAKAIRRSAVEDFYGSLWHKQFGAIDWNSGSYPTITAEGKPAEILFSYAYLDINNDGTLEVVAIETTFFTSIDWDRLWVFSNKQFAQAKREGTLGSLLSTFPTLNPQNTVLFSNGKTAVPVEVHVWRHKGKVYLLLKEHFFAKEEQTEDGRVLPNAFYVSILEGQASFVYDQVLNARRLVPKMTCRFVWPRP